MKVFLLIVIAIIGYILGGFNGAILTSQYVFHDDIRKHGSGNAGLTNFFRTYGLKGFLMVVGIDAGKTLVAVLLGGWLMNIVGEKDIGQIFAGFCVIIGHVAPVLHLFKGGKGVLCAGIMILIVDPIAGICCWAVFAVIVLFTRYVSLASCIACLMGPIFLAIFKNGGLEVMVTFLCALTVVIKHIENFRRLINGTENKIDFSRAKRSEE